MLIVYVALFGHLGSIIQFSDTSALQYVPLAAPPIPARVFNVHESIKILQDKRV